MDGVVFGSAGADVVGVRCIALCLQCYTVQYCTLLRTAGKLFLAAIFSDEGIRGQGLAIKLCWCCIY
jgi:hypothetical protein